MPTDRLAARKYQVARQQINSAQACFGFLVQLFCHLCTRVISLRFFIFRVPRLLLYQKGPAVTGQLVFLCGGDEELFSEATKDLDLMGKVRVRVPQHM